MSFLFCVSILIKNNGVADIGYGMGFAILTGTALMLNSTPNLFTIIVCVFVFFWAVRIAIRIFLKNKNKPEDFRYRTWRENWGKSFIVRSFFQIYILQGCIIFIIVLPVIFSILYGGAPTSVLLYSIGMSIALSGLILETLSDHTLDTFISDKGNKGKILQTGLWSYSRHPNYFGESMIWVGIGIASSTIQPFLFVSIVSPLLITFLLLKVSGIPLLEKRWEGNTEWGAYKAVTSPFIPLPPRVYVRIVKAWRDIE